MEWRGALPDPPETVEPSAAASSCDAGRGAPGALGSGALLTSGGGRVENYTSARCARPRGPVAMAAAPGRILIIRPSSLGDVCRTVPVLASLRAAWPGARIDWLVEEPCIDAIRAHPALSHAVPMPSALRRAWWHPPAARGRFRWLQENLRAPRYDLVLDCEGSAASGMLAWWTRAPRRIGPAGASAIARACVHELGARAGGRHAVERALAVAAAAGAPGVRDLRLHVPAACAASWTQARRAGGLEGSYAVFAPASRWASRRWPAERWQALVPHVLDAGIARVAFVGAVDEIDAVRAAVPRDPALAARCTVLAGRTTVGELMAAIGAASLVVAGDTAALRIADGLARPCVALLGPSDPALDGPFAGTRWVVKGDFAECEPPLHFADARLGDRLMRRVRLDAVAARVAEALAGTVRAEPAVTA